MKNKLEYKRIENRIFTKDLVGILETISDENWEIFWYFENVMGPNEMLYRMILRRPKKKGSKTIL